MQQETVKQSSSFKIASKLQDYKLLIKFNLSFMVVFSAVICYLLAPKVTEYDWGSIVLFFVGGMLVTGSANAINQVVEKDTDAMMKRTAKRPIASGRMSATEGWAFAIVAGIAGTLMLWHFNFLTAALSALSLFVYAFIYTPLKKVNSISVLVGAVPGALPCLIGWAAGNDDLSAGGWALFAIQFIWQFPHFWAIAWVAHQDYSKAGFKLLPADKGPTKFTALQALMYSVLMLPIGILPNYIGLTGQVSMWIVIAANLFMVWQCARLYKHMDVKSARRVMFSSYMKNSKSTLSNNCFKLGRLMWNLN
jgi:protoheme IX farnesyltransferase